MSVDLNERQRSLARSRERFLSDGSVDPGVRDTIVRSWKRSASFGVLPERPMELPWEGDAAGESALLRAVRPAAENLCEELAGTGIAMLAADGQGRVLGRWGSKETHLSQALDDVSGTPGYVYREDCAGTNGLGTVLEERKPVAVLGAEHFVAQQDELSAFGAPIIHPASGRLEGVIDLVCTVDNASPLMLALATRAAHEVSDRLLSGYALADRALLDAYLRSKRRGRRRPTLAINERMLITTPLATDLLGAMPQEVLLEAIRRAISDGRRELVLDDGLVRARLQAVETPDGSAGFIACLERDESVRSGEGLRSGASLGTALSEVLPGRSPVWMRSLQEGAEAATTRAPTLVLGEVGVGRRTFAHRLALFADQGVRPVEFDAGDAVGGHSRDWLAEVTEPSRPTGTIIIANLDQLEAGLVTALCHWIDGLSTSSWVIGTYRTADERPVAAPSLLGRFRHMVEVPPLRDRLEDISQLVDSVSKEIAAGGEIYVDPDVVSRLALFDWPGNVRQLRQVLAAAIEASPGSRIRVQDLPSRFKAPAQGRPLSRIERLERAAIMTALDTAAGNKRIAAASLGISRSTLYRKLTALGIERS